jgi:uncharacterized protein with PQ loop repeat
MTIGDLLDCVPIAAAVFAIPQFVPQIIRLRGTGETAGVSWSWATLTGVNNAAWLVYFALSGFWTALAPSSSAALLAGALAMMLALRGRAKAGAAAAISAWAAILIAGFAIAGRTGLGTLLTAAFALQVVPSIWTAYRTNHPTGISNVTWMLVFGELSCWTIFGLHRSDPRLIILGFTGVAASTLMLARIRHACGIERSTTPRGAVLIGRRAHADRMQTNRRRTLRRLSAQSPPQRLSVAPVNHYLTGDRSTAARSS